MPPASVAVHGEGEAPQGIGLVRRTTGVFGALLPSRSRDGTGKVRGRLSFARSVSASQAQAAAPPPGVPILRRSEDYDHMGRVRTPPPEVGSTSSPSHSSRPSLSTGHQTRPSLSTGRSPALSISRLAGRGHAHSPSTSTMTSATTVERYDWNSVCERVLAVFTQHIAYPDPVEVRVEEVTDLVRKAIASGRDVSLLQQDAAALIATGIQMLLPAIDTHLSWDLGCLQDFLHRWTHLHTRVIPFLEASFLPLRLAHRGTPWLEGLSRQVWLPNELAMASWRDMAVWPYLDSLNEILPTLTPHSDLHHRDLLLLTAQMLGRVCNAQKALGKDRRRRLLSLWQEVASLTR